MPAIIQVEGVSKRFRKYPHDRTWTLQESILRGFREHLNREYFWALKEVSFEVEPGRMTGLIGQNGAGKSTLLRLIGGVGLPDQGRIVTQGRIGALIEVGAGFHPDLTGRENVIVNGVISGLTRKEISQQMDEVVDFAELEEFIDQPYRTYSTGMQMRLAFSVAVQVEPQILLIDEVLAVGDQAFRQKCIQRIQEFKQRGCAIVLVSHDTDMVARLCDEVLWLVGGRVKARGSAPSVTALYVQAMNDPIDESSNIR